MTRDATMNPVREIQKATHFKLTTGPSPKDPKQVSGDLYKPCSSSDPQAIEMSFQDIDTDHLMVRPVTMVTL